MAKIVIINGRPGVGKTTLARRLNDDLGLAWMGKDTIKEFLFDQIGIGDRAWSRVLGQASATMLMDLLDVMLKNDIDFIVENAFWRDFARKDIGDIAKRYNAECLEIYCFTDEATRIDRFFDRIEKGERHPGHAEMHNREELKAGAWGDKPQDQYDPIALGEVYRMDMTTFSDDSYQDVRQVVKNFLAVSK